MLETDECFFFITYVLFLTFILSLTNVIIMNWGPSAAWTVKFGTEAPNMQLHTVKHRAAVPWRLTLRLEGVSPAPQNLTPPSCHGEAGGGRQIDLSTLSCQQPSGHNLTWVWRLCPPPQNTQFGGTGHGVCLQPNIPAHQWKWTCLPPPPCSTCMKELERLPSPGQRIHDRSMQKWKVR